MTEKYGLTLATFQVEGIRLRITLMIQLMLWTLSMIEYDALRLVISN